MVRRRPSAQRCPDVLVFMILTIIIAPYLRSSCAVRWAGAGEVALDAHATNVDVSFSLRQYRIVARASLHRISLSRRDRRGACPHPGVCVCVRARALLGHDCFSNGGMTSCL